MSKQSSATDLENDSTPTNHSSAENILEILEGGGLLNVQDCYRPEADSQYFLTDTKKPVLRRG